MKEVINQSREEEKSQKAYQFEARRESDFAGVIGRSNDILSDSSPLLGDAGASDDVPTLRPLVLALLHAAYDLAQ